MKSMIKSLKLLVFMNLLQNLKLQIHLIQILFPLSLVKKNLLLKQDRPHHLQQE